MAFVSLPLSFHLKMGQLGSSVALFAVGVLGRARWWAGPARVADRECGGPPRSCRSAPVRPRADAAGVPPSPVAAAETDLRTCVSELASDLASRIGSESRGGGGSAYP